MANPKTNLKFLNCMIGRQIRLARNMQKMNMAQLGRALGVTYQQLQKYETGINRISAARLFKASQVLNQPITFFYDEVIDDLAPHIGYNALKTAHSIEQIKNKKIKSHLMDLVEQMRKESI